MTDADRLPLVAALKAGKLKAGVEGAELKVGKLNDTLDVVSDPACAGPLMVWTVSNASLTML